MYIIFFLGLRSTSIEKLNKNNNCTLACAPVKTKSMTWSFKMLLIQIHHISDIFKFGWKIYCNFFFKLCFSLTRTPFPLCLTEKEK